MTINSEEVFHPLNNSSTDHIVPSIHNLREKESLGEPLTPEERIAVQNFDRFRTTELNKQPNDILFHKRYRELQVMANLGEYKEFLKDFYFRV